MDAQEKQEILEKAKLFFKNNIVENHIKNTKKLKQLKSFNVNPFLEKYLASFVFGDASPENVAKALIYPRILGIRDLLRKKKKKTRLTVCKNGSMNMSLPVV